MNAKLIQALQQSGLSPQQITQALQTIAGQQGGNQRGLAGRLLEDSLSSLLGAGVAAGGIGLSSALSSRGRAPEEGSSSPGTANSRYFINPDYELDVYADVRADQFRTNLLNWLGGLFPGTQPIPDPISAQDRLRQMEEMRIRQGRDLTERDIMKIKAAALADQQLQQIIEAAATERAGIQAGADVKRAGIQAGADVEKQRLSSSYGYAQNVLQSAIENVIQSGVNKDRSTEATLATIM